MTCCADSTTGLAVAVSLKTPNAPFEMAVTGAGSTKTVTLTVGLTGFWLFRIWLVDLNTAPQERTLTPPDGEEHTLWDEITNSSGVLTKEITHNGAADSWYLAAVLVGPVGVSSVIQFS